MGMAAEENLTCPKCGAPVSKEDKLCKNCGAELTRLQETVPAPVAPVPPYERKFSMVQRFWKLFVSPSEAMQDIALAPDYVGSIVILVLRVIVTALTFWLVFQKIRFVGGGLNMGLFWGVITFALALVFVFLVGMLAVFWLVKSVLVEYSCESGSGWSFRVAAAVTGYAYIIDLLFAVFSVVIVWFLVPSITLDISSQEAVSQSVSDLTAQIGWMSWIAWPLSFVGLLWKSFLGALGTHFGTKEKCSLVKGLIVFFLLGAVGFLFSFIRGF